MSLLYISFNFSVFEFFIIKYWRKYMMLVKIITGIWKSKKMAPRTKDNNIFGNTLSAYICTWKFGYN